MVATGLMYKTYDGEYDKLGNEHRHCELTGIKQYRTAENAEHVPDYPAIPHHTVRGSEPDNRADNGDQGEKIHCE